MRNYRGSILTNRYALGGELPRADFAWSRHICRSHAKWYQNACDLEAGDIPFFGVDVGAGAYPTFEPEMYEHRVRYVAEQLLDGIEWMQKVAGREYNDDLFFEAVWNYTR